LIILITPRVLKTVNQAAEVTDEYRRRINHLEDMLKTLNPPRFRVNLQTDSILPVQDEAEPLTDTGPVPIKHDGKAARNPQVPIK